METIRLDKMICSTFGLTRTEAKKEIAAGNVTVNGAVIRQSSCHCLTSDLVCLNGKSAVYQKYFYIMMNKPAGVLSATSDKRARTAVDLLPKEMYRHDLFVAGRLDKDTTGFLLLTNDGDFAHDLLSPKKHIPKTYIADLLNPISSADVRMFADGIRLSDFIAKPAFLRPLTPTKAEIVVVEGKFHQIKRMFHAIGNEVLALHRKKMGELVLDEALQSGEARYITDEELLILKGFKND